MAWRQRITLAILATVWVGLLLACSGAGSPSTNRDQAAKPDAEKKWPYEIVESKTERTGHRNVMELYAFAGDIDRAELEAFCKERKSKSPAEVFYYVVIFDKAANAKFPKTPFTAEYGDEEDSLKHIRAIYCYNKVNGFSELRYHPQNIWEHTTTRVKI
jgi:hypothetical protein